MKVSLLTIAFNAAEWLEKLFEQHRDWPGLCQHIFVEFCDRAYANANPGCATDAGLSTDGTTALLHDFESVDQRVTYIPLGFTEHPDRSMGKMPGKRAALAAVEEADYFVVLDSDEFYTKEDQRRIIECMETKPDYDAFIFHKREIWRPPAYQAQSLFSYEVVGGFWGIPCCHTYRWSPGVQFRDCHNTPQRADGTFLNDKLYDYRDDPNAPAMIHLGYASSKGSREEKQRYYEQRGEVLDPQRRWYTESRNAWNWWRLGRPERASRLPHGAKVIPYEGPVPEVFREDNSH